jgi:glucose dehydrogenase
MKQISIILLSALIFFSCKTKTVVDDKKDIKPNNKIVVLDKEFLKEGFINNEIFRVVIVTERNDCKTPENEIAEMAKKRSSAILKNYIISQNRIYDSNSNATIINLIEENGKIISKKSDCTENRVYYLDIKMPEIKKYILNSSKHR